MSRLDPSIPMGVKAFQAPDIMESQGKVMQLGDMMQRRELQKQQIESNKALEDQRKQALAEKKKAMEEDELDKKAFSEAGSDTLNGIKAVMARNPERGLKYMEEWDKHLKSQADQRKVKYDNDEYERSRIVSSLTALQDNPTLKSKVIRDIMSTPADDEQEAAEQQALVELVKSYDPANPESKSMLLGSIQSLTSLKDQLAQNKEKEDIHQIKEHERIEAERLKLDREKFEFEKTKPATSTKSNLHPQTMTVDGKPENVLVGVDPDDTATFQKVFLKGQDVTDKAGFYKAPPTVSATIQNSTAANKLIEGLDEDTGYALDRATNNMPPSKKLNVINTVTRAAKNGNTKVIRDVIKQAAVESEPVAVQANIRGRRETVKALTDIEGLLKDVPQGLISGTVEDVARKLGTTKDPKLVKLGTRLTALNQAYRKAITGAQFSQQEAAEYSKVLPSYSNTAPVNKATIEALRDALNSQDAIYWDNKLGEGWTDAPTTIKPASAPAGGGGKLVDPLGIR